MADTDKLLPYRAPRLPVIPGGEQKYLSNQLADIEAAIKTIVEVLKLHESRLAGGGL